MPRASPQEIYQPNRTTKSLLQAEILHHHNATDSESREWRNKIPARRAGRWMAIDFIFPLTFGLFLSALETTIVSTTLDTIAKHFDDEREYSWIVTAYMVTFNGFLLLHARLSDVFGRFVVFFGCLAIFALFSGVCGAAQTMTQLIVFRALQGIGASGLFSLTMVIVPDITPDRWLGLYSGVVSSVFAFSSVLGPVLGGVLAQHSTWRWVFLLNLPGAAVCAFLLVPSIRWKSNSKALRSGWKEIDVPGAFLFLAATILLIYALQSASTVGDGNGWSSKTIIGCLVGSGVSLVLFIGYELVLPRFSSIAPFFPLPLLLQPDIALLMISAFFMGSSFYSTIIQLPQRLQHVNDKSPTAAGVLLLPVLLPSAGFSALSGGLYRKFPRATPLLLFCGGVLQVIGVGLLSTLPTGSSIPKSQYGFEVLTGVGFGLMLPSFMILARDWVSEEQYATAMGLVNTFRTLGGCVSIAICGAILNKELNKISTSSKNTKTVYGDVYNKQFFVMAILSMPSALATGIILIRQHLKQGVFKLAPVSSTVSS
ncbi:Major facilitator superfamily domain, general substrate transporter [Fusarium austroafricanum]|uniref:Major facilitator superfamily domain, general substrate transporter n=1 Tax=Fusarium austroafricanum TaxID=2364996 RepID=A0A8H4JYS7_9HYPO|nr:Major facilitator superfamily domain, general substrate transporter [Fusarium austroafricanum]